MGSSGRHKNPGSETKELVAHSNSSSKRNSTFPWVLPVPTCNMKKVTQWLLQEKIWAFPLNTITGQIAILMSLFANSIFSTLIGFISIDWFFSQLWVTFSCFLARLVAVFCFKLEDGLKKKKIVFTCLFLAVLGLCCFSLQHVGFGSCCSRALGHRLSSCDVHRLRCSTACEIFPDQSAKLCLCIARWILHHWAKPGFLWILHC